MVGVALTPLDHDGSVLAYGMAAGVLGLRLFRKGTRFVPEILDAAPQADEPPRP